jgi:uncharacterized lipoprotein YmbA
MMKKYTSILVCCMACAVIMGCASTAPSRFYTLSPASIQTASPQAQCSVSVGPISLPALVDRRQIVLRTGPNQVFIDEFDRWASPLNGEIGRVVVENLVSLLGTMQITMYNQPAAGVQYRAVIDILRFDSELGKAATLDALWTVSSVKDGRSYRGRTTITEATKGEGYPDLVAAHSIALGKMSADIAKKIQEMDAAKN